MNGILVCVPTYNAQDSIEATLQSIVTQTSTEFDVLLVDNKSTDQTVAVARHVQEGWDKKRFHISENEHNLGRIGNWNRCLALFYEGAYDYLKFVFVGDTLKRQALEILNRAWKNNPDVGMVAAAYDVAYPGQRFVQCSFPVECTMKPSVALWKFCMKGNWVGAPLSCMWSRSALHGLRFSEHVQWAADWKLYIDVVARCHSLYMTESIGTFHVEIHKYYGFHYKSFSAKIQDARMRLYAFKNLIV
jgi:glycosyltransferase involved in cell wall biosynthesis